jgi:hypothetical protein
MLKDEYSVRPAKNLILRFATLRTSSKTEQVGRSLLEYYLFRQSRRIGVPG